MQDLYKITVKTDPNSQVGAQRAYYMPDDIILNTRRAFSIGTSTANGYSATLGAPEGRYIAPANSADCLQLARRTVCAAQPDDQRAVVRAP